jgi:hypothetical protein
MGTFIEKMVTLDNTFGYKMAVAFLSCQLLLAEQLQPSDLTLSMYLLSSGV